MASTVVHQHDASKGAALSDLTISFGKRVLAVRHMRKMTQEELAQTAELSRNYVNDVERGRRNVTLATIARLAGALGVKMDELMPD
jgi:transcriptional regulator with XRE-family HTH domain